MSLLTMIQRVAGLLAAPVPDVVFTSTDANVKQWLALANIEGRELSDEYAWQRLVRQKVFQLVAIPSLTGNTTSGSAVITNMSSTTGIVAGMAIQGAPIIAAATVDSVDSATQITISLAASATSTAATLNFGQVGYDLPTDFGWFVDNSMWNRTFRRQIIGPLTASAWQWSQAMPSIGIDLWFRIFQNQVQMYPIPQQNGAVIAYEYITRNWCESSTGTGQTQWAADTDVGGLDEELMAYGVRWRFRQAKGLPYQEELRVYTDIKNRLMGRDGGRSRLSIGIGVDDWIPSKGNIPDGNWTGLMTGT